MDISTRQPSPETLTELFQLRQGNVDSARHVREILQSDSNRKGAEGQSWVRRFRQVVESPADAQRDEAMDLDTFAKWNTAFAVLVPVSYACAVRGAQPCSMGSATSQYGERNLAERAVEP